MDTDVSGQTRAAAILARLDRLPGTRHIWRLIALLSLGGMFELYDLFMTAYVVPGLMKAGLLTNVKVSIFAGPALFVAATFTGLFIGTLFFGYVADRYGRRTIFTYSMLWYSAATLVMAFQDTGLGVSLWRLIAGIGIGVELVTIDTYRLRTRAQIDARSRVRLQPGRTVLGGAGGGIRRLSSGADQPVRDRRLAMGGRDRLDRRAVRLVHPPRRTGEPALADQPGSAR